VDSEERWILKDHEDFQRTEKFSRWGPLFIIFFKHCFFRSFLRMDVRTRVTA